MQEHVPGRPAAPDRRRARRGANHRARRCRPERATFAPVSRADALSTPRARRPKATFSSTVMCGKRRYCWNITPHARCSDCTKAPIDGSSTTCPRISIDPRSIASSPARQRRMVVLPAPFGPSRATTSPSAALSHTSRFSEPRATTMWARSVTWPALPHPTICRAGRRARRRRPRPSATRARSPCRDRCRGRGRPRAEASVSCPGSCRRT